MKTTTISIRVSEDLKKEMDEAKEKQGINWNREIKDCIMKKLGYPMATIEKIEELVKSTAQENNRIGMWMLYWYSNGFSEDNLQRIFEIHVNAMAKNNTEKKAAKKMLLEMERVGIRDIYSRIEGTEKSIRDIIADMIKDTQIDKKVKEEMKKNLESDSELQAMARILVRHGPSYIDIATLRELLSILYGDDEVEKRMNWLLGSGLVIDEGVISPRKHIYHSFLLPPEALEVMKEFVPEKKEINVEKLKNIIKKYPFAKDILIWIGGEGNKLKPEYNASRHVSQEKEARALADSILNDDRFKETIKELIIEGVVSIRKSFDSSVYYQVSIEDSSKDAFTEWWIDETS